MTFPLAACAEMIWRDRPIEWRASRLKEMGFGVGLWNYPGWDVDALVKTGATFTIMNGYLEGRLTDAEGCEMLLASAAETASCSAVYMAWVRAFLRSGRLIRIWQMPSCWLTSICGLDMN